MTKKAGFILRIIPRILCKIHVQEVPSQETSRKSGNGILNKDAEQDSWTRVAAGPWLGRCREVKQRPLERLIVARKISSTKGWLTGCLKANGSAG
jgi:hypothetical protein